MALVLKLLARRLFGCVAYGLGRAVPPALNLGRYRPTIDDFTHVAMLGTVTGLPLISLAICLSSRHRSAPVEHSSDPPPRPHFAARPLRLTPPPFRLRPPYLPDSLGACPRHFTPRGARFVSAPQTGPDPIGTLATPQPEE